MMRDTKVRYGIAGFGRFAERAIAPAIRVSANSELVALQKRSLADARGKAAEHGIPLSFDSVGGMVAHPDVDAVFLVSANSCHCPETLLAARAGKHVLVEKPMAMNAREAEEMIAACARHSVKLSVGHMLRFSPLICRMRDIVRSGGLGRVHSVRADFIYDGRLSRRGWLYDRSVAGGGPVFDIGVHCLDTLRFILGDEVSSVKSELDPWPTALRTESTAHLLLRFNGGTIGAILCSFDAPTRRMFIEIVGTEGMLAANEFTSGMRTVELRWTMGKGENPAETQVETIDVPNLYVEEITRFSDCILTGREPELSGLNGLQNQRVIDQAMVRIGSPIGSRATPAG
jgi:predicted dehydrogenase